jgi:hypothetical protein
MKPDSDSGNSNNKLNPAGWQVMKRLNFRTNTSTDCHKSETIYKNKYMMVALRQNQEIVNMKKIKHIIFWLIVIGIILLLFSSHVIAGDVFSGDAMNRSTSLRSM